MNRLVMVSGSVLALAFVVAAQEGCSSSDSTGGGTNTTPSAGAGNTSSVAGAANTAGGAIGTAGAATGTAGAATSTAGAANGTAGAATGAGGATTTSGGAGGATTSAGAGGAATAAGAGGTTTAGGATGGTVTACTTEAKGLACTAATPAGMACGKTCGVKGLGATKSETCNATTMMYDEGMCLYPTASYACYKLPATAVTCAGADATTTAVTSGAACTAADCMPCGPYADSTGTVKLGGLCTCTGGKWTCASAKEWPPQM
jgi:hypothetical protein